MYLVPIAVSRTGGKPMSSKRDKVGHVKHAKFAGHKATPTGEKGPAKTNPVHGKKNRIPYDANNPKRKKGNS